ncbi:MULTISPECIES: acyl carrier protein [Burkholderia]|uniref:acyl carrier protein n=1 Tax=Burkholderia TaxID=32008 RepID=UPI00084150BE|nr:MULTISPECIES: acyl carrier protein [unclassified Burkholderia]AOK29882.1 acyl carrier protein [Burkholderia sp. Bp7605]
MDDVTQKVKNVTAKQLGIDEANIKLTDSFTRDLGADSLDRVELIMTLEEELCISIPNSDADKLETPQQVVDYIQAVANRE